jgi:crotonobetainyl-CoA:carnitine CoA-transferase CaiB-like acyl-CoA transferase
VLSQSLTGLKIIDFTQIAAGPTCTMLLADLGADVIKVEAPSGDLGRTFVPVVDGQSVTFMSLNRNKRSITLDLKNDEHLAICLKLLREADVVVESFRPGVMQRLSLGYETLRKDNPRLIYCSVSAYGQTGPWRDKPGVDGVIQAVSGLMSVTGSPDTPPCKIQVPIVDIVTGYLATVSVLAAIAQREVTGAGQHLDISMFGSAVSLQQSALSAYLADKIIPQRMGSAAPYAAPNEALRCSDGWIMVAAYQPARWKALCEIVGMPELLTDLRFIDLESRITHRVELVQALESRMSMQSKLIWITALEAADIICAPINNYAEVVSAPPYIGADMEERIEHPSVGVISMPRSPLRSSGELPAARHPPPILGEHTREILLALGYSDTDMHRLFNFKLNNQQFAST